MFKIYLRDMSRFTQTNEQNNNNSPDKTVKGGIKQKFVPESSDDDHGPVGSSSTSAVGDEDWMSTRDILDLEVIAEQMFEKKMARTSRHIDDAELRQYTLLAEADFEEIEKTDSLLEQAYELYLTPGIDNVPRVKRMTKAMIERLQKEPHFYCPYEREEPTNVHVSRWINKYTSNPEKELLGFTSKDPFEPKRYISSVEPRVSISDTNVLLGKRKRKMDEDDTVCVSKCSSETRLVCDSAHRAKKTRKPRRNE